MLYAKELTSRECGVFGGVQASVETDSGKGGDRVRKKAEKKKRG